MEKEIIPEGLQSLRDEFVAFRAELRIEMITIKERLRRINEQPADDPTLIRSSRRLMYLKNRADYSSADITRLAVHLGISEQSITMRIERLSEYMTALNGQAALPEDGIPQIKNLDLAEAETLKMLTYETLP